MVQLYKVAVACVRGALKVRMKWFIFFIPGTRYDTFSISAQVSSELSHRGERTPGKPHIGRVRLRRSASGAGTLIERQRVCRRAFIARYLSSRLHCCIVWHRGGARLHSSTESLGNRN